jgi:hypothetical protein
MTFTLGRMLKRIGVTQKIFRQTLEDRYNYTVSERTVNGYCSKECPSPYPCWEIIQKCLKEQYGIEYINGRWQEVKDYGEKENNRP